MEIHPEKSKIIALRNGIIFLGYRIFYHYSLISRRSIKIFKRKVNFFEDNEICQQEFSDFYLGWKGYAKWADSYRLRKRIEEKIKEETKEEIIPIENRYIHSCQL